MSDPSTSRLALQLPESMRKATSAASKALLLEERTSELYSLRAQLETERYEKSVLKSQIKQYMDKILNLNQEQKKLQAHLDGLTCCNDRCKCRRTHREDMGEAEPSSEDEHIKKQLYHEISQKEAEISKLTEILCSLNDEKFSIQEKLMLTERQVAMCVERIKELTERVEKLTLELDVRDNAIVTLTNEKISLEVMVAQLSAVSHVPPVADVDVEDGTDKFISCESIVKDVVDASCSLVQCKEEQFAINSKSLDNLRISCTAMYTQLRERETEAAELRVELNAIRGNNARLATNFRKLAVKYAEEFGVNMDRLTLKEHEDEVDLTKLFVLFVKCMEQLTATSREEKNQAKALRDEALVIAENGNAQNNAMIETYRREIDLLKSRIVGLEVEKTALQRSQRELEEILKQRDQKVESLDKQKYELISDIVSVTADYAEYKQSRATYEQEYIDAMLKVQHDVELDSMAETVMNELNTIKEEAAPLQNILKMLQQKLETISNEYDATVKALNEKLNQQKLEMDIHQIAEQKVKEQYEKLLIQYEAMKEEAGTTNDHLEKMRNQLAVKELQMVRLGVEIVDLHKKNVALEQRINQLMNDYITEKNKSEVAINTREIRIKEIDTEREKLKKLLEDTQNELLCTQSAMKKSREEFNATLHKIQAINTLLNISSESENDITSNLENIKNQIRDLTERSTDSLIAANGHSLDLTWL